MEQAEFTDVDPIRKDIGLMLQFKGLEWSLMVWSLGWTKNVAYTK